ncbi:hypothetical protein RJ639_009781 [Escallonia herrerae]|uniref:Methyltransferase type 12 domain-containing protein n=1 Tax=Escallonia herrerae TaxID=1293975 RepID=A0AA88VT96_9ASTE|nr:hypothetical protein RJ639_009781 [Escallonia herrerae]
MRVPAISIPFVSFRLPSVAGSIMAVRRLHSFPPLTVRRNMALQDYGEERHSSSSVKCTKSGVIHPVSVIYVYCILFACECNNVFLQFFKDRHYLEKEWGQYFSDENTVSPNGKVVLEVGCGAGNTIFPLVAAHPKLFIHACDFSPHAISLVKSHTNFNEERINVFVCDITEDDLCDHVTPYSVDTITLHCSTMELYDKVLICSQRVLFFFEIMRLKIFLNYYTKVKLHNKNQIISENFYYRGDGTLLVTVRQSSFYFSEDFLSTLFLQAGFSVVDVNVYCREVKNRSRKITMQRY